MEGIFKSINFCDSQEGEFLSKWGRFSDDSDCTDSDSEYSDVPSTEDTSESTIINDLKTWAYRNEPVEKSVDDLLKILQPVVPGLPKCAKTLLNKSKPLKYTVQQLNGGAEFVYFGLTENLQRIVNSKLHQNKCLLLQFNIDGLPLFKSTPKQFWPILAKIFFKPDIYKPFIVAIWCGKGKPESMDQFFDEFIKEFNYLAANGVLIDGDKFDVKCQCFICDKPARSLIKSVKGHTAFYACERCITKGERIGSTTVYPSMNSPPRTDSGFRNQDQKEHHTSVKPSPLTSMYPAIDMVIQFILDWMHLACLGAMKRFFVEYWTSTKFKLLNRHQIFQISQRLLNLSRLIPSDFQRGTRSLAEISSWKATEFRFFLLYCGPFILKDILPDAHYKHFLLLFVSFRILCSSQLHEKYCEKASEYLHKFVELCPKLYGNNSQVFNIHNLIHIADDVKNFKCSLNEISAFPFESALGKIKKSLRSGYKPMQQIVRKIELQQELDMDKVELPDTLTILRSSKNKTNIQKIKYLECAIGTKNPDNFVLLNNDVVFEIESMSSKSLNIKSADDVTIVGKKWHVKDIAAIKYPENTASVMKTLEIQPIKKAKAESFSLSNVCAKLVLLEIFELAEDPKQYFVVPMLH